VIEGGDIKLGAVVVDNGIGLFKQVVYLPDHLLTGGSLDGTKKNLSLSVPFRGPAQRVALLNYVVWVYVLVPQTPGIYLVGGCFNI